MHAARDMLLGVSEWSWDYTLRGEKSEQMCYITSYNLCFESFVACEVTRRLSTECRRITSMCIQDERVRFKFKSRSQILPKSFKVRQK